MRQANRRRWKQSAGTGLKTQRVCALVAFCTGKCAKKSRRGGFWGLLDSLLKKGEVSLILKISPNAEFKCENRFHKISIIFSGLRELFRGIVL